MVLEMGSQVVDGGRPANALGSPGQLTARTAPSEGFRVLLSRVLLEVYLAEGKVAHRIHMLKTIESTCRNGLRSILVPGAIRALRRRTARLNSLEESIQLAEEFNYLGIKIAAFQIRREITGLLRLLAERPPRTLLEIGTAKGGTFFLFSRVATPDALLVSLDLRRGKFGGGYAPWQDRLYRSFAREQQRIELVLGDSHRTETFEQVKRLIQPRPLDFLFIDGDHSYEGVKADFKMYSPLVHPHGLIAFHDIVPGTAKRVGGVPRFWQETKRRYRVSEIVADWQQGGFGIGVIHGVAGGSESPHQPDNRE